MLLFAGNLPVTCRGIRVLGGDGEDLPGRGKDKVAAFCAVDKGTGRRRIVGILNPMPVFIEVNLHDKVILQIIGEIYFEGAQKRWRQDQ